MRARPGRGRVVEVALAGEELVAVHAVNLHGHAVGPAVGECVDGRARLEEDGAGCARTGQGEALCRHHAERDAGVHQPGRQPGHCLAPALDDLVEADLLEVFDAGLERREDGPVVQVRGGDGVSCRLQGVGERATPGRQPECVVEQDDVGHETPLQSRRGGVRD